MEGLSRRSNPEGRMTWFSDAPAKSKKRHHWASYQPGEKTEAELKAQLAELDKPMHLSLG